MSTIKRRLLPLAFLASVTTAGQAQPTDASVTLSMIPLPNSQQLMDLRVRMVTDMKVTPREGASEEELQQLRAKLAAVKMPLRFDMTLQQRLQTGLLDAQRRMPISASIESSQMEVRNGEGELLPGMPAKGLSDMRFSARVVDGRYEDIRVNGENLRKLTPELLEATFRKTFDALAQLNGARLKVGESIELPLEMALPLPGAPSFSNATKVLTRYTLTRVQAGVAYFDIGATLDFRADLPLPPAAASAAASAAEGAPATPRSQELMVSGKGTGQLQLRLADRLPLRNDLDMEASMHMALPDGHAMQMTVQVQTTSVGRALRPSTGKVAAVKAPRNARSAQAAR